MTPHWFVISPEIVLYAGGMYEPDEYGHEVVTVEAPTRREAIRLGVKAMTKWPKVARLDEHNPFAGVKAEPAECPHGFCWCELNGCDRGHAENGHGNYCEKCDAEVAEGVGV